MKHFFNRRETIVTEALDGLLRTIGSGDLARLDGYPEIKVVLRADWDKTKVSVVSGGGAGHEPSHAGFVGKGMLTAAVSGEIFASPSVEAVLAAIRAVTGPVGCLLIVKNYTGDRLNFGLAAEKARAEGFRVDMVIVADDIALPDIAQPRGVAGTLFVHKIAGHLSETGHDLAAISAAARAAAKDIVSLGMSLSSCSIPASRTRTGSAKTMRAWPRHPWRAGRRAHRRAKRRPPGGDHGGAPGCAARPEASHALPDQQSRFGAAARKCLSSPMRYWPRPAKTVKLAIGPGR